MQLNEKILMIYPELEGVVTSSPGNPLYSLQDDTDGRGTYISDWNYEKPQPTQEQLDAINED